MEKKRIINMLGVEAKQFNSTIKEDNNIKKDTMKFNFDKGKSVGLFTSYTQKQIDVIDSIVNEANKVGIKQPALLAYMLATTYHECYNWNDPKSRMTQLVEMGGIAYLKGKKYYPYYGRGYSHLTWLKNYQMESDRLKIDLVKNPDILITDYKVMANSHVYCMMNGSYTGKKLTDYITTSKVDFKGARRVVNGTDKADEIAKIADKFLSCIG